MEETTIKELRKKSGLYQEQFAKKYNIPVNTIRNWEQGRYKCPTYIVSMISRIMELESNLKDNEKK